MPELIFILILLLFSVIFLATFLGIRETIKKKHTEFVLKNSILLKKLQDVNNKYQFSRCANLDQFHVYDNENTYETVSCQDYLIYQLQFIDAQVTDQIVKINLNKELYKKYADELKTLVSDAGKFPSIPSDLQYPKLIKLEKWLFKKHILPKPHTEFSISVTLYCSTRNGRIYAQKYELYNASCVLHLIKQVKDRRGKFFNVREIWDAICRVERGKVSNKMRFSIYERDGYRCCKCGASDAFVKLEIDHIVPISKGGQSTYDNLQTLCHKCNVEKGNRIDHWS